MYVWVRISYSVNVYACGCVCGTVCVYLGFSYQYCYCCCCCKLWNMEFLMDLPMKMHSLYLDTFVAVIIAVFLCCWLYIVVVVVAVIGVVVLKSRTKNKTYQQRFDSILIGGVRTTHQLTFCSHSSQPQTRFKWFLSVCLNVYVYVCTCVCARMSVCVCICVFVYAFVVVRVVFLVMCQHKGLQILRRRTNWLVGWLLG